MILIEMTGIILYLVLIAWTWYSLGSMEKKKKIGFILFGIILIYGVTWLIFPNVQEQESIKEDMQQKIQNILVFIFTGINGMIVMPQMGKLFDKVMEDEIKKEKLVKRFIILMVVLGLCTIFERGYMRDTQEGILRVYEAMK